MRKVQSSFFVKENLIHPYDIFHDLSKCCPHFIHPLHTIIKRSIAYTQNYITKNKKCFSVLKKTFTCSKLKASLRLAYLLRSQFQTIIQMLYNTNNIFYFTPQNFINQNFIIQFDKFSHPWWIPVIKSDYFIWYKNWENIK